MAKKKSKKKGKLAKEQNQQGAANPLGLNVKEMGTALAGVIVGEIIQVAIDRLMQSSNSPNKQIELDQGSHAGNPIQNATSTLQENISDTKPAVKDALQAVRSVVSEMTPDLGSIVGSLRDVAQQSTSSSVGTIENTAGRTVEGAVDTARTVVNAFTADIDRNITKKKNKKDKKNKKKNKKK